VKYGFLILFSMLVLNWNMTAQIGMPQSRVSVQGQISADGNLMTSGMEIRLYDPMSHSMAGQSLATHDGSFQITGIEPGRYQMEVTDPQGRVIQQSYVYITGNEPLRVQLSDQGPVKQTRGTVSARMLTHRVPKNARKQFEEAEKSMKHRDTAAATEHLERAVEIDPEYMQAHNNLGARYAQARRFEDAVREFQRTVELEPDSVMAQTNLMLVLLPAEHFDQAERQARLVLQRTPSSLQAAYVLGASLYAQKKYTAEAVESLRKGIPKYPQGHLMTAEILGRQGDYDQAAKEAQAYLESGNQELRDQAQALLKAFDGNQSVAVKTEAAGQGDGQSQ